MPVVTGKLTDFGLDPMRDNAPRIVFEYTSPGVSRSSILAMHPVVAESAYNGYFEAELVDTASISPAGYYRIYLEWRDDKTRVYRRDLMPGELYVPAAGGVLADLLRVPANPALVWTGAEPPANPSPGSWWQNPAGDIYEWGGKGWNFKNNIRGPAGYNAAGAEATDVSIAAFIAQSAGATATGAALAQRFVREVMPEAFGAKGGSTDDTAALRAALAAAAGGKLVISQPHKISGSLIPSKTLRTQIEIRAGGALVQHGNFETITHAGSARPEVAVTAGAAVGSTAITLATVADLAVSDTLMIYSDDKMPNDPGAAEAMLRTVRSIAGNVVTLDAPLYVSLPTAPRAAKIDLAPKLTITGPGEIRHNNPASITKALVHCLYADAPTVSASLVENGGPGLQVTDCLGGEFSGHIRDLIDDTTTGHYGYGINATGCTRGFRVHSGSATRCRHAFTTGSHPGHGGPENCHVESSFIVRDTTNAGLDTHAPGFGNVLHANTTGCSIGVQDRARNTRILGHVDGATLYGVNVTAEARDTVVDVFLSGMKAAAAGGVAIRTPNVRLALAVAGLPSNVPAINATEDFHYDGNLSMIGAGKALRRWTLASAAADQLYLPADRLIATGGAPELMTTTYFWPSWALSHGANESAGAVLTIPSDWRGTYQVIVRGVNLSTDTGAAALRLWRTYKTAGDSTLTGVTTTDVIAVPAGPRGVLQDVVIGELSIAANEKRPLLLKIERRGSEAADTLAGDFGIESITLRKSA